MISNRVLRPLFISAAAVVTDASKSEHPRDCKCKPSELPIYTKEPECKPQEMCITEPGPLESTIGTVRRAVVTAFDQTKQIMQTTEEYAHTALAHTEGTITYLRQEENVVPRYGAVAIGGFSGFIFGLRGGFFKRFIYTSAGALGIAAICYPAEAKEYSKIGLGYVMIAYNFIVGAKKDDPPLSVPSLPKMPDSLSEAWDTVKSLGQSNSVSLPDKEEKIKEANNKDVKRSD
ncbi:MICOS complex subunit MIC27 isoform X2 [Photinus pyralis]|uniref:MICOS complex subunit n=1 Tax=Photinus pyralis TaxID=7054 RepID=A0A1Y1KFN5_PHOPY|nr:MICOS complex subunit MIC27 isoform X2 [Photinus pyralis]